ncbi:MAG: hypothetical protein OEY44_01885 [Candidatus Peregrinibacteria bacterium]|nr:hypothetical protein [Candidatus Peregrinibacteria bacterium]
MNEYDRLAQIIRDSNITEADLEALNDSGRITQLLRRELCDPEFSLVPVSFATNYDHSFYEVRDSMRLNGLVNESINPPNRPRTRPRRKREFFLMSCDRLIEDGETHSELLHIMSSLELDPAGAMELCFFGADRFLQLLMCFFKIVARKELFLDHHTNMCAPTLLSLTEPCRVSRPPRPSEALYRSLLESSSGDSCKAWKEPESLVDSEDHLRSLELIGVQGGWEPGVRFLVYREN